jgi:hypothetical protein
LIDGCRESEVSRECLTGDTVCWLWNGFNARQRHGLGDATGARSGPLAKMVLYYKAHLAVPPYGLNWALYYKDLKQSGITLSTCEQHLCAQGDVLLSPAGRTTRAWPR